MPSEGIGAELEAAVVAAGRNLSKLFEDWIVATPDRRKFAVRITSYWGPMYTVVTGGVAVHRRGAQRGCAI